MAIIESILSLHCSCILSIEKNTPIPMHHITSAHRMSEDAFMSESLPFSLSSEHMLGVISITLLLLQEWLLLLVLKVSMDASMGGEEDVVEVVDALFNTSLITGESVHKLAHSTVDRYLSESRTPQKQWINTTRSFWSFERHKPTS